MRGASEAAIMAQSARMAATSGAAPGGCRRLQHRSSGAATLALVAAIGVICVRPRRPGAAERGGAGPAAVDEPAAADERTEPSSDRDRGRAEQRIREHRRGGRDFDEYEDSPAGGVGASAGIGSLLS